MSNSAWLPTPLEIARDPELAILAALQAALDVTTWSLFAQYPELADELAHRDPLAKQAASLVEAVSHLRSQIGTYRAAVALHRDLSDASF